jgi:hypothetical protein
MPNISRNKMSIDDIISGAKKIFLSKKAISIYFGAASIGCGAATAVEIKDLCQNPNIASAFGVAAYGLMTVLTAYGCRHLSKDAKEEKSKYNPK